MRGNNMVCRENNAAVVGDGLRLGGLILAIAFCSVSSERKPLPPCTIFKADRTHRGRAQDSSVIRKEDCTGLLSLVEGATMQARCLNSLSLILRMRKSCTASRLATEKTRALLYFGRPTVTFMGQPSTEAFMEPFLSFTDTSSRYYMSSKVIQTEPSPPPESLKMSMGSCTELQVKEGLEGLDLVAAVAEQSTASTNLAM